MMPNYPDNFYHLSDEERADISSKFNEKWTVEAVLENSSGVLPPRVNVQQEAQEKRDQIERLGVYAFAAQGGPVPEAAKKLITSVLNPPEF